MSLREFGLGKCLSGSLDWVSVSQGVWIGSRAHEKAMSTMNGVAVKTCAMIFNAPERRNSIYYVKRFNCQYYFCPGLFS